MLHITCCLELFHVNMYFYLLFPTIFHLQKITHTVYFFSFSCLGTAMKKFPHILSFLEFTFQKLVFTDLMLVIHNQSAVQTFKPRYDALPNLYQPWRFPKAFLHSCPFPIHVTHGKIHSSKPQT